MFQEVVQMQKAVAIAADPFGLAAKISAAQFRPEEKEKTDGIEPRYAGTSDSRN
jgi:hypothetical protein